MYRYFTEGVLWGRFREFIALGTDRFSFLEKILKDTELEYKVAAIAGNRHFFISPPRRDDVLPRRQPVILSAHYDRASGSPGANDNSAGVFLLIETAMRLRSEKENNWIIILTDKEELEEGESILKQGSYTLAEGFKTSRMQNARIFSFDACGTGDTLIISTTAEHLLTGESPGMTKLKAQVMELQKTALETVRELRMEKVLLMPTPFSDDAGFLRAGMAAQTITMLPREEAARLISALRKKPSIAGDLVSRKNEKIRLQPFYPETWRCMNTPSDSHLRLTPKNYPGVIRFARGLCGI
ncbi:MAG: Zn-dependent exopeptidase M28 [Treponema sp.]|jgi:hypothetical protein|nr:Zn-dependent exopeptidase M28 [Treponema sp.]